jgi:crotonobetainyl-CoA:carnitine CoA-transferase CaiB-like acyl-CoA transferase
MASETPELHSNTAAVESLPLHGVRVIDLTDDAAGVTGRFLAEMGADVVLVEPPDGAASRRSHPMHDGNGLRFATAHCNKRGIVLDLTQDRDRKVLLGLTDGADIVIESHKPGELAQLGIGPEQMRSRNPSLVVASITAFGQSGAYRDLNADEMVLLAMSSTLTRSGAPGREPLCPPGNLGTETAASHMAYPVLLALYRATQTGSGEYIDCSLFDFVVADLDPGFGMTGSANMGQPLSELPPGRPDVRRMYPTLPCADGHVRLFIAAPRHWHAMFDWLGKPEKLADPSFENIFTRFMKWPEIKPEIEALFADRNRDDLVAHGVDVGIPIASLNTPDEILDNEHSAARKSFVRAEVIPGHSGTIPNGFVEFDGVHAGFRQRAPQLGEHTEEVLGEAAAPKSAIRDAPEPDSAAPLAGLRVLDLGVIVAGAEAGRLLADFGAEVIKIENASFPDGSRQADPPGACSAVFALGHRGKLGLGLNLRAAEGAEIFRRLVAKSDVVLSNFKPGTMESLGFGYEELRAINPGIVVADNSALGNTGPWSRRMGYGPLVRAAIGLTQTWRHPDSAQDFGDDLTIYPDHAAARVEAAAVIAALLERQRTGQGRKISVAQMETVFCHLATEYLRESLQPGTMVARGNDNEFHAPAGLFACTGEDAYCAVTIDSDEDWRRLTVVMSRGDLGADSGLSTRTGRLDRRDVVDSALQEWIAGLTPQEAQDRLQAAGIRAGAATHVKDLLGDPHLTAREQIGQLPQPGHDKPIPASIEPALFENIARPQLRPAPRVGEHTRQICRTVLEMSDADIDELLEAGVLELTDVPSPELSR